MSKTQRQRKQNSFRLDYLLAHAGFGSRKEVKKQLKSAAFSLAGEALRDPSTHIEIDQIQNLYYRGNPINIQLSAHLLLNKPAGYLTALEDRSLPCVAELLTPELLAAGLKPCGRLDLDSEGALLFTNDGQLLHRLSSPKHEVEKVYYLHYTGKRPDQGARTQLENGSIILDDRPCLDATVYLDGDENPYMELRANEAIICIREGRYHQVKRMFSAIGAPLSYLRRIAFGPLHLDDRLPLGSHRLLEPSEVEALYQICDLEVPTL
ncbi:MAG: pseudouridine synthase [Eubacteriales bacterium]|nr:pseudouridine synthase [Eubacteriales bacterium]